MESDSKTGDATVNFHNLNMRKREEISVVLYNFQNQLQVER